VRVSSRRSVAAVVLVVLLVAVMILSMGPSAVRARPAFVTSAPLGGWDAVARSGPAPASTAGIYHIKLRGSRQNRTLQ